MSRRFSLLEAFIWMLMWEWAVKRKGGKLDVDMVNWRIDKETETLHLNATYVPPVELDHINVTLTV